MGNIIVGILFVIGGVSGEFVLIGTNSGELLALLGFGLVIKGFYDLSKNKGVEADAIHSVKATGTKVALDTLDSPQDSIGFDAYAPDTERSVEELGYEEFCPKCQYFQASTHVCTHFYFNVSDYPEKYKKKCDGDFYSEKK